MSEIINQINRLWEYYKDNLFDNEKGKYLSRAANLTLAFADWIEESTESDISDILEEDFDIYEIKKAVSDGTEKWLLQNVKNITNTLAGYIN